MHGLPVAFALGGAVGGPGQLRVVLDVNQPIGASLLQSFGITVAFTLIVVAISWCLGVAGAISLQRVRFGRGALRTLFLVPYALPVFAAVITWRFLLQRDKGMLNHVLVDQLVCWTATRSTSSGRTRSGRCAW